MSENLVIIPTYKEKENIEKIIRYVFNLPMAFDILIIDDNSPDGTADIVKTLMTEFSDRLFMIQRAGKLGLGTAYIMASSGPWSVTISMCSRWMPTSRTTPMTCQGCMMPVPMAPIWLSVPVTRLESTWSTGPWDVC